MSLSAFATEYIVSRPVKLLESVIFRAAAAAIAYTFGGSPSVLLLLSVRTSEER